MYITKPRHPTDDSSRHNPCDMILLRPVLCGDPMPWFRNHFGSRIILRTRVFCEEENHAARRTRVSLPTPAAVLRRLHYICISRIDCCCCHPPPPLCILKVHGSGAWLRYPSGKQLPLSTLSQQPQWQLRQQQVRIQRPLQGDLRPDSPRHNVHSLSTRSSVCATTALHRSRTCGKSRSGR